MLLDLCTGNSSVPGEFPSQKPVTQSFDVFFDLRNRESGDLRHHGAHYDVIVMHESFISFGTRIVLQCQGK